ncbi:HEAT repeat domain-containing protein [Aquiflexum lacus]|uniref:HEAT repeat domain-containing protein n=1 Tax=Aquiflexum lacus TaxID=2483805 RepID=UPI0018959F93|nr:HEAT repeat domain-containing protein [Aquiflexum lacus]
MKVFTRIPNQSIAILLLISFGFSCAEKTPVDLRIKQMEQEEVKQLASTIESMVSPKLAEGLSLSLWAVDSLIFDPISIQVDDEGTLYYSRTNRQRDSEFDIRGHQDWEIESIKLQSVEDKRAFLRKELSPERSEFNTWLKDLNGDGSHDWRDMLVQKEQIYRVKDTDGDGLADFSQVMVEDFHEEVTDVAGAVLMHEGDLFVGVGPDMWRLKDTNGDGLMDEKESLAHGFAIHIGFGAHGMSGAKVGPDGRIYWGIGDIGFNGTDKEGKEWKYPNRGVVVRSNPDGSDFEVFAMGVRNTHEFTWDEYNNLISVDNDGDHRGESERLVYLVNGSDTGWRINWQFGKYRDPNNNTYKVWMDENMYKPRHDGQAAYITPPIINYVNGPTGMVYNPGTALSPKWRNHFFVVEFVGTPAGSGIHAFTLKPKGATFELDKTEKVLGGVLPTGLDFGPEGSLYLSDWINGWGTKNYGRVWKLDDESEKNSTVRIETKRLLGLDLKKLSEADLEKQLFYEDLRVRRKAQFELAKRGEKGAAVFESVMKQEQNQMARIHAIVGTSQLARMVDMKYAKAILPYLKDQDPEIRAQAAKWLGDIKYQDVGPNLLALLVDEHPRVNFFAAEAIGRIGYEPATPSLLALLERNNDEDAYIRHAVTLALARFNNPEPLIGLSNHYSKAVRLGAVLSLRRMQDAGIEKFLSESDEYILTEVARAINDDFSIESALPALGDLLTTTKFTNEALIRRAINANLRVGTEKSMQNLIIYMSNPSAPISMRKEAIDALSTWTKPSVLDRVDGRYRGEITREPDLIREKAFKPLVTILAGQEESLRESTANALGKLGIESGSEALLASVKQDKSSKVRIAAIQALAKMNAGNTAQGIEVALADREKSVRIAGLTLLEQLDLDVQLKVKLLTEVIEKQTTEEKQAAIVALGKLPYSATKESFDVLIAKMDNKNIQTDVLLELSEAIENINDPGLKDKYAKSEASFWEGNQLASYQSSLNGGDPVKGKSLFLQSQTGQCMRCHAIDDMGGNVGPAMDGIASKLSKQELLESLIDPSKRIAPGYGIVTLDLDNGQKISGILGKESQKDLLLQQGSKPDTLIQKTNVVARKDAASSMPDMKAILSRREIRDLVSYLSTLKDH